MKKKPYSTVVAEDFVRQNLEHSEMLENEDLDEADLPSYDYDQLPKTEIFGFPCRSEVRDPKGNLIALQDVNKMKPEDAKGCHLRYSYLPLHHELYVGTTGSGKTTGAMEPQLRAISSQKNKPNIFITDPKGELYEHNARHLTGQGYRVYVLNFKEISRSHRWNPLGELYDKQVYLAAIKKPEQREGPIPEDVEKAVKGIYLKTWFYFDGKAYPSRNMAMRAYDIRCFILSSEISSLVNALSLSMIPRLDVKDPTWDDGARAYLQGIILLMLDEAVNNPKFTREMCNIKTINDFASFFQIAYEGSSYSPQRRAAERLLRGRNSEITEKLMNVLKTADNTRRSYMSHYATCVERWNHGHIYMLTADTTIDISEQKKPFAVFVATRDYEKSDYTIAALFIDYVYRARLEISEKAPRDGHGYPQVRDTHFLLDEFANIPAIPDFDNKIATARSRRLWFHLYVQSYEQLNLVYGEKAANIIVDNCNTQSFLGSQSQSTKERFSKECGIKTIPSISTVLRSDINAHVTVPVLPISKLDLIEPGTIFTKRLHANLIKTYFVRSYVCSRLGFFADFYDPSAFAELAPENTIDPYSKDRMHPAFLEKPKKNPWDDFFG